MNKIPHTFEKIKEFILNSNYEGKQAIIENFEAVFDDQQYADDEDLDDVRIVDKDGDEIYAGLCDNRIKKAGTLKEFVEKNITSLPYYCEYCEAPAQYSMLHDATDDQGKTYFVCDNCITKFNKWKKQYTNE
jgi:hypothetical protein